MNRARHTVSVRVPASTSNCGAGFDSQGLALSLYNRVTLTRTQGLVPLPEQPVDESTHALVVQSAERFWRVAGTVPVGFYYRIEGEVPAARGLGSSATIIAGVLVGLDSLHETRLPRPAMVKIATAVEGNPENVSASLLGGFTVSRTDPATGEYVDAVRVTVPREIAFVVASPSMELRTVESRGALPPTLPFADAVKSLNSASFFAAAFVAGDYEKLRQAVGDFVHEPYRLPKIPGAGAAIDAGIEAGALTGWLSGSGSSVLCVCYRANAEPIAASMCAAFWRESMPCEARVLSADNDGARVERA
ncbi:homoserine kinase [Opitutus terrae]|uniref:Homoserine kinase n=1 Tax=Opitutus terrae (strain DSM 11246 / JCM 15787 / PB90-1) TaxID=452637 RepID=B1ZVY5_OPITP|nr:homoserine kinase [Opitutus terrae]ACB76001.1 homoserine kinase [Opitutus terrae PB90-1]